MLVMPAVFTWSSATGRELRDMEGLSHAGRKKSRWWRRLRAGPRSGKLQAPGHSMGPSRAHPGQRWTTEGQWRCTWLPGKAKPLVAGLVWVGVITALDEEHWSLGPVMSSLLEARMPVRMGSDPL